MAIHFFEAIKTWTYTRIWSRIHGIHGNHFPSRYASPHSQQYLPQSTLTHCGLLCFIDGTFHCRVHLAVAGNAVALVASRDPGSRLPKIGMLPDSFYRYYRQVGWFLGSTATRSGLSGKNAKALPGNCLVDHNKSMASCHVYIISSFEPVSYFCWLSRLFMFILLILH